MGRITIYDKNGAVRHESMTGYNGDGEVAYGASLEYTGNWMG